MEKTWGAPHMTVTSATDDEEARHSPGPEKWWGESWYFDFVASDGSVGGYCRLGLYPNRDASWFWFHTTGGGLSTVQIRDHALACPNGEISELGAGDWRSTLKRGPDGWNITLNGEGLALKNPLEALGSEAGDPVDIEAELAWVDRGPVFRYDVTTRYEQTCRVAGRLRLGERQWAIRGGGQRDHSWGVRDWTMYHFWSSGSLSDGSAYHVVSLPEIPLTIGYLLSPEERLEPLTTASLSHTFDSDGLPRRVRMNLVSDSRTSSTLAVTADAVGQAPVSLPTPDGGGSRFPRSIVSLAANDGRRGWGWIEYNLPRGDQSVFLDTHPQG